MSDLIRAARDELGITGAELAARLGVTAGAVSQIERSERSGRIRIDTLSRALEAMQLRLRVSTSPATAYADYTPAAVTDRVNEALDRREPSLALRVISHAADMIAHEADALSSAELADRPSSIKDERWEQLFRAVYGGAIPESHRPDWAVTSKLQRRWYVSRFPSLQEKAKVTTPDFLRELNIYVDANSLSTR
ncbi:helix-turn-helix domain-containing protein [Agromyces mediolanus]|uniref:helix-turn-helix domain-containing protein n=1 Tax=Agromyces mediolanus TaxID=41986 RepID=UPI00203A395C|nr:helix-turn-helix domain-containing protein [Agromyces mediolanus]MCM3656431.1 helix-turn-helix domain-containing protein [Agromyces mediolanus]